MKNETKNDLKKEPKSWNIKKRGPKIDAENKGFLSHEMRKGGQRRDLLGSPEHLQINKIPTEYTEHK